MATAKPNSATTASITAPIGGWNARDSIAQMPPTDAVTLNNFLKAMSFTKLREKLTEAECYKIMNIGKAVNRKLFKANKALKR